MICPKCKKKPKCIDTYGMLDEKGNPKVARRYRCSCGNDLYTMEQKHDPIEVMITVSKRYEKQKKE